MPRQSDRSTARPLDDDIVSDLTGTRRCRRSTATAPVAVRSEIVLKLLVDGDPEAVYCSPRTGLRGDVDALSGGHLRGWVTLSSGGSVNDQG